ncbi:MAG: histidine ammonia-lyase [Candidatus Aminicenantes bacterium]|nr:histidine ammonia-lyase [Candidatus Aminicenantes bacterium]
MKKNETFQYGLDHLTPTIALAIADGRCRGLLNDAARRRIESSRQRVAELASGDGPVYGINTGFGPLCTTRISPADTRTLQRNLLMSHASGMGETISPRLAKLMLILKAHALCRGHSGVAVATVERIIWHIENDIIPLVPSHGSVGASGDLAPLSHLFLPLIGLGHVQSGSEVRPTAMVLAEKHLEPIHLGPKEGLALINGTQFITAHAALAVLRLQQCLDQADIAGAMSLEALSGSNRPFLAELHCLRPHPGVQRVARRLTVLLQGSQMVASHAGCSRVQDAYSLRCMPQVHGASRQAWSHLQDAVDVELNAVTDNPVILDNGEAVSGGNFHGQPLALPLDYAALAASELGNISDRRIFLMLHGNDQGLPKLLLANTGLQSGFMISQYTSAALACENKTLCFPASADSIPTSLGQEDHVSMGSISARKLHRILDNLERILAVEFTCAAQGMDFRRPLRSTTILEAVHACIRGEIVHADGDRVFAEDLARAERLVHDGLLLESARRSAAEKGLDWESDETENQAIQA